jgi:hypothetical protein
MRDEQINQAIDRAIRELLDVDPRPDLRARVLAGIERQAAPHGGWSLRLLGPIAAAAVVILALVLRLPSRHVPVAPVQSTRIESPAVQRPTEPVRPLAAEREPPRERVARTGPARPVRSNTRVAVAMIADAPGATIAPLESITPIRVAAVTQSDITPQPISIEPLAPIAQVQIAPLTPPDGRH